MATRSGEVGVSKLPTCDFCRIEDNIERPARFDFRTMEGPWANGCLAHFEKYRVRGPGLGVGFGQRLLLPHESH